MLSSVTFTFFIILRSSFYLYLLRSSFNLLRSSFNLLFIILVYLVFCVFTHTNSKSIFIVWTEKHLTNINP